MCEGKTHQPIYEDLYYFSDDVYKFQDINKKF